MIINKFIAVYYLFLFFSFAIGLLGAGAGLRAISGWGSADTHEKRYHLEKLLYLCTSAIFLGIVLRIVMIPLWFLMLDSLIPLIPGAMCMAGAHLNVPVYSWLASSMKVILPLIYFTWIIISRVDRRLVEQPFLKFRHFLLVPLILLILAETFLDLKYLFSLKVRSVTCCAALFDYNTGNISKVFTENHWYFVIIFGIFLLLQAVMLLIAKRKRNGYAITAVLAGGLFVTLILGLHTKLSPLILDTPFHHCIFCLLESNLFVLSGFLSLLLGIYLSFSFGLVGFWGNGSANYEKIHPYLKKIKSISLLVYAGGFILLLVPTLQHLSLLEGGS